ncbi:PLPP1_2_3 [Acanthosepion pharaonis]|uniref:PLPP1_2_3 n=1 Tax=Acanthosepion pharaonis TaxID=158019 RepID=A0A812C7U9_ACAPH|nr:PLPP1_2_3 [Sepia pharaonis]
MYPYHESTISTALVTAVGLLVPIFFMTVCEKFSTRQPKCEYVCVIGSKKKYVPPWIGRLYSTVGIFVFGAVVTKLLTDVAKYTVGRLRPHFLDVCKPDVSTYNCSQGYITKFTCTGTNKELIEDARLSFLSGHSSFAMYSMLYLASSFFLIFFPSFFLNSFFLISASFILHLTIYVVYFPSFCFILSSASFYHSFVYFFFFFFFHPPFFVAHLSLLLLFNCFYFPLFLSFFLSVLFFFCFCFCFFGGVGRGSTFILFHSFFCFFFTILFFFFLSFFFLPSTIFFFFCRTCGVSFHFHFLISFSFILHSFLLFLSFFFLLLDFLHLTTYYLSTFFPFIFFLLIIHSFVFYHLLYCRTKFLAFFSFFASCSVYLFSPQNRIPILFVPLLKLVCYNGIQFPDRQRVK